jgi:benzylsuccinate CoA-transferase BbsE subunit
MSHTLSHLRVVDLTWELGWMAGQLFAAMGADVVKVEPPGGDPGRRIGPFLTDAEDSNYSFHWIAYNGGKRSICLDLARPGGREVLRDLLRRSDLVFESFAPRDLARLGLAVEELRRVHEKLIIVSITPYGQDGPYADYRASDLTLTAMGGLTWLCGDPDRAPTRIGVPQAMVQAGAQAAVAAMLAYFQRQHTGRGVHVDLSAQEAITWGMLPTRQDWDLGRALIKRAGPFRQFTETRLRIIFRCRDGYAAVFSVIGKELLAMAQWLDDEDIPHSFHSDRWLQLAARTTAPTQTDYDEVAGPIAQLVARYSKQALSDEAHRRGVIVYPANTPLDLTQHECLLARGYFHEMTMGVMSLRVPGEPFRMAGAPPPRPAPSIGEHTDTILQELGYGAERITALRRCGDVA